MLELVLRLVFSLAVIVGMLLMLARFSAKRFRGTSGSLVRVVHRQPLSRTSALAVVTVGSRVLVLGTTEQQVQLLTELDPEEVDLLDVDLGLAHSTPAPAVLESVPDASGYAPRHAVEVSMDSAADGGFRNVLDDAEDEVAVARTAAALRAAGAARAARVTEGALAGSLLSAQTWKQAFAAATGRTRDAS